MKLLNKYWRIRMGKRSLRSRNFQWVCFPLKQMRGPRREAWTPRQPGRDHSSSEIKHTRNALHTPTRKQIAACGRPRHCGSFSFYCAHCFCRPVQSTVCSRVQDLPDYKRAELRLPTTHQQQTAFCNNSLFWTINKIECWKLKIKR